MLAYSPQDGYFGQPTGLSTWKENGFPQPDFDGVFRANNVAKQEANFPSSAWELEIAEDEFDGFWAKHRALEIFNEINKISPETFWELGAGNGNVARHLARLGIKVICVEPILAGAQTLAKHDIPVFQAYLSDLGLPNSSLKALGMFDVLEHIDSPQETLEEVHRVLETNGFLLVTVPAHQWLYSNYDKEFGHFRRYNKKTITCELENAGFNVHKVKNLFGFLILPALILRRIPYLFGLRISTKIGKYKTGSLLSRGLNNVLHAIAKIESKLGCPLGLSLLVVASKTVVR